MSGERKRILLVSSSGGVLLDLLALKPWWSRYDTIWAAVRAADTESVLAGYRVRWIPDSSIKQPVGVLRGLLRARRIFRKERPNLVLSAGSGPAIPFFLLAFASGIPTFWVSTFNLMSTPGITARICGRLASRVLLQRPSMLEGHPNGIVIGELY